MECFTISQTYKAKIIRAVGGNYFVYSAEKGDEPVQCTARGIFRLDGISPCAGDEVIVEEESNSQPVIIEVLPRKNYLVRPPLANLDAVVFVNSSTQPAPNRFVLDKLVAIADSKGIEPLVVFTKPDLKEAGEIIEVYRSIGIEVCTVNNMTGDGADRVLDFISGRTTAFIGNSGVGKSSLLNVLFPELKLDTAHISKKLGRGRHTTRQVEMYRLAGGFVADTPGFSTVDTERYCRIPKGELDNAFREFAEFMGDCQFGDCAHIKEKGCAVRAAVQEGKIPQSRYDSYLRMYEEASKINDWE